MIFVLMPVGVFAAGPSGVASVPGQRASTNIIIHVTGTRLAGVVSGPVATALAEPPPRLAVREQGKFGSVADLSINGSAFSEAGLVLEGAALNNVQTEHLSADLPVPATWLAPGEVLTGIDLARRSSGHPAGSLLLALDRPLAPARSFTVGGGLDGLLFARFSDLETFSISPGVDGWAGAYLDATSADQVDGYSDNRLRRLSAGGRLGLASETLRGDLLVSSFTRSQGVRGYYGAAEKYPAWEDDTGGLVSGSLHYDAGDDQAAELSAVWTRAHDVYWLDRHRHEFYENKHTADTISLHSAARRHFSDAFFVDLRADNAIEAIKSTALGDHSRDHASLAAIPGVKVGDFEFAAGASAELFTDYDPMWCPAAGVTYHAADWSTLALSYREGVRQPSYTELNYKSPDSLGNTGLPVAKTDTLAFDWKTDGSVGSSRLGLFYARGSHLVDWLKTAPSGKWNATALRTVTSYGASGEGWLKVLEQGRLDLGADAQVTLKDTDTSYWASRYVMDWPLAGAGVALRSRLTDSISLKVRQGGEVWKSNPVRRGSNVRPTSSVEAEWRLPWVKGMSVALGLDDLWNQAFEVFPGQKALGLSGYLSVTYAW